MGKQIKSMDSMNLNQKLWFVAKIIVEKQKVAIVTPTNTNIDWDMLEEMWFDWLEEEFFEYKKNMLIGDRISELEKEYLNLPNKIDDEKIKSFRKNQIELIFDELNIDLPQIIGL